MASIQERFVWRVQALRAGLRPERSAGNAHVAQAQQVTRLPSATILLGHANLLVCR